MPDSSKLFARAIDPDQGLFLELRICRSNYQRTRRNFSRQAAVLPFPFRHQDDKMEVRDYMLESLSSLFLPLLLLPSFLRLFISSLSRRIFSLTPRLFLRENRVISASNKHSELLLKSARRTNGNARLLLFFFTPTSFSIFAPDLRISDSPLFLASHSRRMR